MVPISGAGGCRRTARLAAAAWCVLASVAAARAQSVEVSPLRVELTLDGSASHTQAVTLKNDGPEPVRIRARLQDWFVSRDGTPQFDAPVPEAERPFLATSWVRVAPPEQIVQPGRQGLVRFTTKVPSDAPEGGYRAAILFEFLPPGGDEAAPRHSVQFRSRVATLVYIAVGQPPAAIEMTDLTARAASRHPPVIVATLKNAGRATVRTRGTATLRDAGGQTVRAVPVPNVPLLPMSEREVTIPIAGEDGEPLPDGRYQVDLRLDVGMPALLVGETTLVVTSDGPEAQARPRALLEGRGAR